MKPRNHIAITAATLGTLLLTGCMPMMPAPEPVKEEPAVERTMWQDTSRLEDHYSLKPEPYSLESDENDPELLGPQSTIKRSLTGGDTVESPVAVTPPESAETAESGVAAAQTVTMTRSRCIDLIGKAKYDEYTRRYGSEAAALRRCSILQHVQK